MKDKDLEDKELKDKETEANYMALGMSFGGLAGSVGMNFLFMFGKFHLGGICIGAGLLLGMVIGMMISKKKIIEKE